MIQQQLPTILSSDIPQWPRYWLPQFFQLYETPMPGVYFEDIISDLRKSIVWCDWNRREYGVKSFIEHDLTLILLRYNQAASTTRFEGIQVKYDEVLNEVVITYQSQNKAMTLETKLVVNQVSPDNGQQTSCIAAMWSDLGALRSSQNIVCLHD